MMNTRFILKIGIIGSLILLFLIPQAIMADLVEEREGWRQKAYDSIEASWPGMQVLAGPILTIPYQVTGTIRETVTDKDGKEREIQRQETLRRNVRLVPTRLDVLGDLQSTLRYRGIFQVPVYTISLKISGDFDLQVLRERVAGWKEGSLHLEAPYLSVAVRDQRGIASPPGLRWKGNEIPFKPGSHLPGSSAGMHARLPDLEMADPGSLAFEFTLELRGMRSMGFSMLADTSSVRLSSNWPHPSFTGEMLPESRDISDAGFTALWKASAFSYNVRDAIEKCEENECGGVLERSVGFELLQPVDIYQQSERSVKYGFLFIVLTFVVLILFELLKKLQIHPVQYTLVGFALLMFYLLLISLSEHILFMPAYAIAALACTGLLTVYFGAILRSRRLGFLLGGGLALLYLVLYVILKAEDYALLMGSLLLFSALAALILTSRNLDWYALMSTAPPASESEKRHEPSLHTGPSDPPIEDLSDRHDF
ncbi:MAG: cell envelope integrity protein CreD [Deltaproteobacteria bacterium HGW-Deltaproteobacteria-17]|nr:MAG: cell envelope integrity protein CreD [Deltaproteobacteria bacterium HGW-Deltaproteobacteria-17]